MTQNHPARNTVGAASHVGGADASSWASFLTFSTGRNSGQAAYNMLGVAPGKRRQGWGKRLHRHLMWEAKRRFPLYLRGTDASNAAMRRLFEMNDCTEEGRHWELEPR